MEHCPGPCVVFSPGRSLGGQAVREARQPRARMQGCGDRELSCSLESQLPMDHGVRPHNVTSSLHLDDGLTGWPLHTSIPKSDIYLLPTKCSPGHSKGLLIHS